MNAKTDKALVFKRVSTADPVVSYIEIGNRWYCLEGAVPRTRRFVVNFPNGYTYMVIAVQGWYKIDTLGRAFATRKTALCGKLHDPDAPTLEALEQDGEVQAEVCDLIALAEFVTSL